MDNQQIDLNPVAEEFKNFLEEVRVMMKKQDMAGIVIAYKPGMAAAMRNVDVSYSFLECEDAPDGDWDFKVAMEETLNEEQRKPNPTDTILMMKVQADLLMNTARIYTEWAGLLAKAMADSGHKDKRVTIIKLDGESNPEHN